MVAQSLQPDLTDAQISALEEQGGFKLSDELRMLYRWHNGISTNSTFGLLPGQRFLPLDYSILTRKLLRQQLASAPLTQRAAFAAFAGHRMEWIQVLDDGAGDGYFYDPNRVAGAFFYHMAEEGYYLWFPSLRNFLLGTIECYESRAIKLAPDGKDLDEDFQRAQEIWNRLAASSANR
jgi:hypothetical protein